MGTATGIPPSGHSRYSRNRGLSVCSDICLSPYFETAEPSLLILAAVCECGGFCAEEERQPENGAGHKTTNDVETKDGAQTESCIADP